MSLSGPGRGPWWVTVLIGGAGCGRIGFGVADASLDVMPVDAPIDGPAVVTKVLGERPGLVNGVTEDTTLRLLEPMRNLGATAELSVDDSEVALIRFDLSIIPTSATLVSASLSLYTTPASSTTSMVEVFEVTEAWVEGTGAEVVTVGPANYNERLAGTAWSSPGAGNTSRGVRIAAFAPALGDAVYSSQLAGVVVARWIAQPSTNYGMVLDLAGNDSVDFVSRNDPSGAKAPALTIVYMP